MHPQVAETRRKHEALQHFNDAISDLLLTQQLQSAQIVDVRAKVQSLMHGGASAGQTASARDKQMRETHAKLTERLAVTEGRCSVPTACPHRDRDVTAT